MIHPPPIVGYEHFRGRPPRSGQIATLRQPSITTDVPSPQPTPGDHLHRHPHDGVEQDIQAAVEKEARGTPFLLIQDQPLSGAQPLSAFEDLIEAALQ